MEGDAVFLKGCVSHAQLAGKPATKERAVAALDALNAQAFKKFGARCPVEQVQAASFKGRCPHTFASTARPGSS
eukprot:7189215-Lingulodinium_polyedra.AAC.1